MKIVGFKSNEKKMEQEKICPLYSKKSFLIREVIHSTSPPLLYLMQGRIIVEKKQVHGMRGHINLFVKKIVIECKMQSNKKFS